MNAGARCVRCGKRENVQADGYCTRCASESPGKRVVIGAIFILLMIALAFFQMCGG